MTAADGQGKPAPGAGPSRVQQEHPLAGILGGRPLLTLAFDNMEMLVGRPVVVGLPAGAMDAGNKKKLAAPTALGA